MKIQSAEQFVKLRNSSNPEDYSQAANCEAHLAVWFDVINRYPEMREWVAHNKTVPLKILKILADDPDPRVRYSVAMKRKLDDQLFMKLAKDSDESVRIRIAHNRRAPYEILSILSTDSEKLVRQAALENIKRFECDDKGNPV